MPLRLLNICYNITAMTKILIVDDEPRILLLMKSLLKANGYEVETAKDGPSALEAVRAGGVQIVVTDLRMQPMDGLTLFREIQAVNDAVPVILLTAYASVETAIEAMKGGIFDYLTKPFKVDEMLACLKRAEEKARASATTAAAGGDEPLRYRFENFIASSPAMNEVCETIAKVAPTAATVLINGESGTGKEVVARAIHKSSTRAGRPWVAVNCAAIPENLLESEMFGHVKGAFTGAVSDKEGLFEAANGGTLFLDEISSMPLILQGKFLRALQEREIRRVGDTRSIPVDVRVVAASNANLEEAVVKGTFRSDLFYRLAVIMIDIPPLRERKEDVLPLARHFLAEEVGKGKPAPAIGEAAANALLAYAWPGNVRELENSMRHALTFWRQGEITPKDLPSRVVEHKASEAAAPGGAASGAAGADANASLKSFLRQKEREYIGQILNAEGGDKEKAAERLKVNLSTLYRKLSEE